MFKDEGQEGDDESPEDSGGWHHPGYDRKEKRERRVSLYGKGVLEKGKKEQRAVTVSENEYPR